MPQQERRPCGERGAGGSPDGGVVHEVGCTDEQTYDEGHWHVDEDQESRQMRFEFKEADLSNFMDWLDDFEAKSDCVESDPGDPGFLCTYFEEDFEQDRTTSVGSESVISYRDELEHEQAQHQAASPEVSEVAARPEEAEPPAGASPLHESQAATPAEALQEVAEIEESPEAAQDVGAPEEPWRLPEGDWMTDCAAAFEGLDAVDRPSDSASPGGTLLLQEPWRPPEGDWMSDCAAALEGLDAAVRPPDGAGLGSTCGPQVGGSRPGRSLEDSVPGETEEPPWCPPEGDWAQVVEAVEAMDAIEERSCDGQVPPEERQPDAQIALVGADGPPVPPTSEVSIAASPAAARRPSSEPTPGERSGSSSPAPREGDRSPTAAAEPQHVDAAAAKAPPSPRAQGGKRPLPSPPEGEDASVTKWNPFDSKVYTFEEFAKVCCEDYSDERVLAFWRDECQPLQAKKPRQTSSSEAPQEKAPPEKAPLAQAPAVPRRSCYPAPPSRSGVPDAIDWTLAPPRNPDSAQRRHEIVELELQMALGLWARKSGAPRGKDMIKALAALDIKDLQGLRREVNCRLLPEQKRTVKKGKKLVAREKPAARGGRNAAAADVEPYPLPGEEHSLISLSERILEIERLKQLVFAHVPFEQDYAEVLFRLLKKDVDSVVTLAVAQANLDWRDLGNELEDSVDKLQEEAVVQAKEDDLQRIARRSEMVTYGHNPVLVTAPHNVFLRRDGCTPHMREDYTTFIAQRLALELEGTCLCWTRLEQWRTETRYALGHRRMANAGEKSTNEALDPTNRDPNFLSVEELHANPWHCGLKEWASQRRREKKLLQLHVDVHGCQNPPVYPTHMVLGLGAMRRRIEEMPQGTKREAELKRLLAFADLLQEKLGPAVAPLTGLTPSEIVTVTGLGTEAGYSTQQDFLTGVSSDPERRTLTQQSVLHIGVSHGLQCELSFRLRKLLLGEPRAIDCMARALRACWMQAMEFGNGRPEWLGTRR